MNHSQGTRNRLERARDFSRAVKRCRFIWALASEGRSSIGQAISAITLGKSVEPGWNYVYSFAFQTYAPGWGRPM
jgi:hypothetical protein